MDFVFQILILIMSVVIHETSHGYAALALGDHTAEYQGRLTLNPLKHLDPVGSFIIPVLSYLLGGFIVGWAKPVPYNPYNLRPGRWSEALVALAGPASNIAIAIIFGLFLRLGLSNPAWVSIISVIVFINIILALFNMMPVPPLDGSKLLFAIFPNKLLAFRRFFERFGFLALLIFVFFLWQFVTPLVGLIFKLFTGLTF